jgi:DNA-binding GntR family transcriptional regulator
VEDFDLIDVRSAPEVAQKLRESILTGQLKPGARLVERKWAARFSVGQPTIREALRELKLQGFLRKSRQRGTYVTELSREGCRKLLEVPMALEALAIQRAAVCGIPEALERIAGELHKLKTAARALDPAPIPRG